MTSKLGDTMTFILLMSTSITSSSLTIRTQLLFPRFWKLAQKVLQVWSMAAQRIVRRHKPASDTRVKIWNLLLLSAPSLQSKQDSLVVDEGIHEQPLLDEALPLGLLSLQVPVHVVGDHDAVGLEGMLDNEAVVVADDALSSDAAGGSEHQDLLPLQVSQDVLI